MVVCVNKCIMTVTVCSILQLWAIVAFKVFSKRLRALVVLVLLQKIMDHRLTNLRVRLHSYQKQFFVTFAFNSSSLITNKALRQFLSTCQVQRSLLVSSPSMTNLNAFQYAAAPSLMKIFGFSWPTSFFTPERK